MYENICSIYVICIICIIYKNIGSYAMLYYPPLPFHTFIFRPPRFPNAIESLQDRHSYPHFPHTPRQKKPNFNPAKKLNLHPAQSKENFRRRECKEEDRDRESGRVRRSGFYCGGCLPSLFPAPLPFPPPPSFEPPVRWWRCLSM